MITIGLYERVGSFAENKDAARDIRETLVKPAVAAGEEVTLDFAGITLATQSFIHALISDLIRSFGIEVLDRLLFKNCSEAVTTLVNVVCDYMQDGVAEDAYDSSKNIESD